MIYILFIVLITLGLLLESNREKNTLSIERYLFESKKLDKDLKIVFLSDLHDKEFGKNNINLIKKIENEKPDLILIGGDIVVTKRNVVKLNVLKDLLDGLKGVAPIIYGNGNHELRFYREVYKDSYGKYKLDFEKVLTDNGLIYLSDSSVQIDSINLYGLNITSQYYKDFSKINMNESYLENHIGKASKDNLNILLAHSPLYFDAYEAWGADLVLAGHFHGGVLRIFGRGVLTSQWQLFHKWCCGYFTKNNSKMLVSRGLGGHSINVRLNNLPEISIIELKKI